MEPKARHYPRSEEQNQIPRHNEERNSAQRETQPAKIGTLILLAIEITNREPTYSQANETDQKIHEGGNPIVMIKIVNEAT